MKNKFLTKKIFVAMFAFVCVLTGAIFVAPRKAESTYASHSATVGSYEISLPKGVNLPNGVDENTTVTQITSSTTALNEGWYVVSSNETISSAIHCTGAVNIILINECKLTLQGGLIVNGDDNSLTIYGQAGNDGTLKATGDLGNAGIGGAGGAYAQGCNITINGGTIEAQGGERGAGIGGGDDGSGTNITINGGNVTATGGDRASGIGGGYNCAGSNITINGGIVTATAGDNGAGIGGGDNGTGSNITINGGTVTATGKESGAGIGGGSNGNATNIKMTAGTVSAVGGMMASGIGGGVDGTATGIYVANTVTINAGEDENPTVEVTHTNITTDISASLNEKRYVTAVGPETVTYAVTFDLNYGEGTAPTTQTEYAVGDTISLPTQGDGANPDFAYENKYFKGWSTDSYADEDSANTGNYEIKSGDIVEDKITFYAVWEWKPEIDIYFDDVEFTYDGEAHPYVLPEECDDYGNFTVKYLRTDDEEGEFTADSSFVVEPGEYYVSITRPEEADLASVDAIAYITINKIAITYNKVKQHIEKTSADQEINYTALEVTNTFTKDQTIENEAKDMTKFSYQYSPVPSVYARKNPIDGLPTYLGKSAVAVSREETAHFMGVGESFYEVKDDFVLYIYALYTFDANGGVGTVPQPMRYYGDYYWYNESDDEEDKHYVPEEVELTKEGYVFVGWNTDKNATKSLDNDHLPQYSSTLYAIWQKVRGTEITINLNNVTYGKTLADFSFDFGNDNLALSNVSDEYPSGNYHYRVFIQNGEEYTILGDETPLTLGTYYLAIPIETTEGVFYNTWDSDAGQHNDIFTINYTGLTVTPLLAQTTNSTLVMSGWYGEEYEYSVYARESYRSPISFVFDAYLENGKVKYATQLLAFCKFEIKELTISYNNNSGSWTGWAPETTDTYSGTTVTMPTTSTVSCANHKLVGWSANQNATTGTFSYNALNADADTNDNITMYAVWQDIITTEPSKDNDYTVVVDDDFKDIANYQWYKYGDWTPSGAYYCNYNNGREISKDDVINVSSESYLQVDNSVALRFKFEGVGTITNCTLGDDGYYYPTKNSSTGFYDISITGYDENSVIKNFEVKYATALQGETKAKLGTTALENTTYFCVVTLTSGETATSTSITPKKVTFDDGGATGGEDPNPIYQLENRDITLPSNPYTKTGYSFKYWICGIQSYDENSTYTVGSTDVEFEASWELITYSKDFNLVTGKVKYGTTGANITVTPSVNDLTVEKITLKNGDGDEITTIETAGTYTITFIVTNADDLPFAVIFTQAFPFCCYTNTVAINGTSRMVVMGKYENNIFTDASNGHLIDEEINAISIIVAFEVKDLTLNYNGNTATSGTVAEDATYCDGKSVTLAGQGDLEKTGYKFVGWALTNNATSAISSPYSISSDDDTNEDDIVTLYAVWQNKTAISITETAQTYVYNASAHQFELKGTNNSLSGYTIQYYVNNAWTTSAPTSAGSYNVKIARLEDETYQAYEKVITGGLVITQATNSIENLEVEDVECGEKPNPTATKNYGTIIYSYKLDGDTNFTLLTNTIYPTKVGSYILKATIVATDDYAGADVQTTFEVKAKEIENKDVLSGLEEETVELIEGRLDANVKIVVEQESIKKQSQTIQDNVKSTVSEKSVIVARFDIHLEDNNGTKIENISGNKYKVTLKLPEKLRDLTGYAIVCIDSNENVTRYEIEKNGDEISFVTDHFSSWAVVADETVSVETVAFAGTAIVGILMILFLITLFFKRKITFYIKGLKVCSIRLRPFTKVRLDSVLREYEWFTDVARTKRFVGKRVGFVGFKLYGQLRDVKRGKD